MYHSPSAYARFFLSRTQDHRNLFVSLICAQKLIRFYGRRLRHFLDIIQDDVCKQILCLAIRTSKPSTFLRLLFIHIRLFVGHDVRLCTYSTRIADEKIHDIGGTHVLYTPAPIQGIIIDGLYGYSRRDYVTDVTKMLG